MALAGSHGHAAAQPLWSEPGARQSTPSDLELDPSIVTPSGESAGRSAAVTQSGSTAMPSFLDDAALHRLKEALHAPAVPHESPFVAAAPGTGPAGAFVLGSGLASVLPSLRQIPIFGGAQPPTLDFSGTLTDARRDAGEARVLTEEVRTRAEELSRRFAGEWAIGSNGAASEIAIKVADEPLPAAWRPDPEVASPPVASLGGTVTSVATADQPSSQVQPTGEAAASGASTRLSRELEGRMGLGHGTSEPEPALASATAEPAASSSAGVYGKEQARNEQQLLAGTVATRQVSTVPVAVQDTASLAPGKAPLPARPKSAKRNLAANPVPAGGPPPQTSTGLGLFWPLAKP